MTRASCRSRTEDGGVEPRKGTDSLVRAFARVPGRPVLAVVGGHSFQDMTAWYADALAFPSVKEGFGLAVLEAMSAGVPVGDVGALARALDEALTDDVLRARLVYAGVTAPRALST